MIKKERIANFDEITLKSKSVTVFKRACGVCVRLQCFSRKKLDISSAKLKCANKMLNAFVHIRHDDLNGLDSLFQRWKINGEQMMHNRRLQLYIYELFARISVCVHVRYEHSALRYIEIKKIRI